MYGPEIADTLVQDAVRKQTNNRYEVSYEKIDISILKKNIALENLAFFPINSDTLKRSYEIEVPKLDVAFKSVFDIYWNKTISFEHIVISDPKINILRNASDTTKTSLSIESGDLIKLIEKSLFSLEIDSLGISNATVKYKSLRDKEFEILLKEIDLGVSQFHLDSLGNTSKFLFTDNITLRLTNQHFLLADSIHEINVGSLDISTRSQNVLFKNIQLHPRKSSQDANNTYVLDIPELNFRGIDFKSAYRDNELRLDSIRILNPKIKIARSKRKNSNKDLLPFLFTLFNSVDVGKMMIDQGSIHYQHHLEDDKYFNSKRLNVEIHDFHLDSTFLQKPFDYEYFQQFRMIAEHTNLFSKDSVKVFSITHFEASSMDSILIFSDLKMDLLNIDTVKSHLSIKAPEIRVAGLDFRSLWLQHEIKANQIQLSSPDLSGYLALAQKSNKNGFLNTISIDQLNIDKSRIDLDLKDQKVSLSDFSTELSKISVPNDSLQNGDFTEYWQTNYIESSDLFLGTLENNIKVGLVKIDSNFYHNKLYRISQTKGSSTPIDIDTLVVNGLKVDSLLHSGFIIFDSLVVHGPHFTINLDQKSELNADKLNNLIHKTFFKQVRLDRGKVNVIKNNRVISHMDSISTTLSTFHYDTIIDEYFTGIDFQADTIHISFTELHHGLSGSRISISQKDSTLDIHDLSFLPYSLDSVFNHYKIHSSELKLRQLNFHKLINDQEISFSSGFLTKPDIDIIIETPKKEGKNKKPKDLISFESFNIGGGNLNFLNNMTGFSLTSNEFDVLIHDFDMLNDSNLFFAKNYLFDAKQTVIGVKKLDDSIRIGYSIIDTDAGNFSLHDVAFKHSNTFDLHIPIMKIKGLVTEHLLDNGWFNMDSLILHEPIIKYGIKKQSDRTKPSNPPNIKINNLSVFDGNIGLHKSDLNFGDSIFLNKLNLSVEEFIYDSLIRVEFSHHLFKSLDISGRQFEYTLPDSLYKVRLSEYSYNHVNKTIDLSNLKLIPIYNRGEFQSKIDYQQDWFDGSIQHINISGFEIDSLISNELLQMESLSVTDFTLDTHRDKRIPRKEGEYKALPQTLMSKAPIRMIIDTINVYNAFVSHSEFSETGTLPGTLFFQQIDARITNFTNDSLRLLTDQHMIFDAAGVLLETGDFNLSVDFDLTSKDDQYSLRGSVGDMDLTELNDFLQNTAFVSVRSGASKSIDFYFDANEEYALGEMTFYYDDLKISVLNQESYDTKGFGASLKTFFANTFVVNTKNPHFIFVRDGNIFHERDKTKSIFNYWGKALLSGVVSSIGAKNNKKEIKSKNDEIRQEYEELKKSGKL